MATKKKSAKKATKKKAAPKKKAAAKKKTSVKGMVCSSAGSHLASGKAGKKTKSGAGRTLGSKTCMHKGSKKGKYKR